MIISNTFSRFSIGSMISFSDLYLVYNGRFWELLLTLSENSSNDHVNMFSSRPSYTWFHTRHHGLSDHLVGSTSTLQSLSEFPCRCTDKVVGQLPQLLACVSNSSIQIDGRIFKPAAYMLIRNRIHDFISGRWLISKGKPSDRSRARPSWLSKKKSSVSFLMLYVSVNFKKNKSGLEMDHLPTFQGEIAEWLHQDCRWSC
jgi:hypothetical protein